MLLTLLPGMAFATTEAAEYPILLQQDDAFAHETLSPHSNVFPFTDVPVRHWGYDAIRFMFEHDLMRGISPTSFAPGMGLSRAMAVTILYRMAEKPEVDFVSVFRDVAPGRWYSDAVAWAYDNNIVQGVGSGRFAPSSNITREEMAVILYRFAVSQGYAIPLPRLPDVSPASPWAETAMQWAVSNRLIRGTNSGGINPRGIATRAEAATILMRFMNERERWSQPFVLTISVEETSVPQGEPFWVHVELKNNSGEDHDIAYAFLLSPYIPGEYWISDRISPWWPLIEHFESGSTIPAIFDLESYYELSPGVYELTFEALFYFDWEPLDDPNELTWTFLWFKAQHVDLVSNTIEITIQ